MLVTKNTVQLKQSRREWNKELDWQFKEKGLETYFLIPATIFVEMGMI